MNQALLSTLEKRNTLPQLSDQLFITDGGLETTLIYEKGFELPLFAAFILIDRPGGIASLKDYARTYIDLARDQKVGLIVESATWRASLDWGHQLGYTASELRRINRLGIRLLKEVRDEEPGIAEKVVISGCVGPRADGYKITSRMDVTEARLYHRAQIQALADAGTDMIGALTMTHPEEAIGISLAAQEAGLPVAISFTVEVDGRLPSGESLEEAISFVDAVSRPTYYMINCAHPTHFSHLFQTPKPWHSRVKGIRANASSLCHAELDECEELDAGNPTELGEQCRALRSRNANITILGGCCGTDQRHIHAMCEGNRHLHS